MKDCLYQVHMNHNSYSWVCFKCGLPNFSTSSLFASFDVTNSFQVLDHEAGITDITNTSLAYQDFANHVNLRLDSEGSLQPVSSPKSKKSKGSTRQFKSKVLKILNINFQSIVIKFSSSKLF